VTPEKAVKLAMEIRREARKQGVTLSEPERLQLMSDAATLMAADKVAVRISNTVERYTIETSNRG